MRELLHLTRDGDGMSTRTATMHERVAHLARLLDRLSVALLYAAPDDRQAIIANMTQPRIEHDALTNQIAWEGRANPAQPCHPTHPSWTD